MVFFTCNNCGESVKKPSVEKHYNTKCRGTKKNVSCMDCQKDFQDNYVTHTKCISELEKYSGKDYVPRENQNKGEKKQEGWVGTVRGVLDSSEYNLDAKTRSAFEKLQNYNNVPQKKAKFLNFVTNSVHIPRQTVETVWSILEKEQQKLKQARQAELEAAKKEKKLNDKIENKTKATEDDGEPKKKKKKKQAQNMEGSEENEPQKMKVEEQNGHIEPDDNKNKKKNKNNSLADSCSDYAKKDGEKEVENGVDSKRDKKLKKNQETNGFKEDEQNEVENIPTENGKVTNKKKKYSTEVLLANDETQEEPVQKKKKKSKTLNDDIDENKTQPHENGEEVSVKKKKKTDQGDENSYADVAETESPLKKEKNGIEINETSETEEFIFFWEEAFDNIMNKHDDGITLEKLKKKILKKYITKFEDELTEKQLKRFEKKFNKKLKKNTFLQVEGDIVKPVS